MRCFKFFLVVRFSFFGFAFVEPRGRVGVRVAHGCVHAWPRAAVLFDGAIKLIPHGTHELSTKCTR